MDANENIDANLDKVLRASGSALRNYTMPVSLAKLRDAMRSIMSESYIKGSNDCHAAMTNKQQRARP
jgi:hypothetical protein